jgi:enoyl-CoA hydratase
MSIQIEDHARVRTVTHDRREVRNAMDSESADALNQAMLDFDANPNVDVAVLWGAGGAFCAGWDLKRASALSGDNPIPELTYGPPGSAVPRGPMGPTRLALSKPVIAAIEGPAVAGGMEIALWCDLRVMARDAFMGVFCRRWGVPLIDGGTVRLPRVIGRGRALDLILTGRKVEAEECLSLGLCERVVESGEALVAAQALAAEIARFPQACMRADRASVYAQSGHTVEDALRWEFEHGLEALKREGLSGASRFADGSGRHGSFENI